MVIFNKDQPKPKYNVMRNPDLVLSYLKIMGNKSIFL